MRPPLSLSEVILSLSLIFITRVAPPTLCVNTLMITDLILSCILSRGTHSDHIRWLTFMCALFNTPEGGPGARVSSAPCAL